MTGRAVGGDGGRVCDVVERVARARHAPAALRLRAVASGSRGPVDVVDAMAAAARSWGGR